MKELEGTWIHRAGQEIRYTVNIATTNINRTVHNDEVYFWSDEIKPEDYNECRYPSKGFRDISNVAPEEVKAIGKYISNDNSNITIDLPKEISSFLGYSKINSQTREQIEVKLS